MEAISYIVLILLSLLGYSAGVVRKAGKLAEPKPQVSDLIIITAIWIAAVWTRASSDVSKWFMILAGFGVSFLLGYAGAAFRKWSEAEGEAVAAPFSRFLVQREALWERWKEFSRRTGSFQSRMILSVFFFLAISPIAVLVKILSDPLKIKRNNSTSYWIPRKDAPAGLEQFRRQF